MSVCLFIIISKLNIFVTDYRLIEASKMDGMDVIHVRCKTHFYTLDDKHDNWEIVRRFSCKHKILFILIHM